MSDRTAAQILSELRARTVAQDVSTYACIPLLEQDQMLMRLTIAWRKVRPGPIPEQTKIDKSIPRDREVRWLWSLVEPDPLPRWIEIAGLPVARHTLRACYVLIDNEAVVPDGSLAVVVERYIQQKVGMFLRSMMPRRAQAAPPPPPPEPGREQTRVPTAST